jgi:1-deoxy-D-xylulose-5-phosphate synthase
MEKKILELINSPADLKKLNTKEISALSDEIREFIIEVVAANGGHLAPNLGTVELTLSLHYVFDAPSDKIIWDVGHQGYAHKILTGRREFFKTLRQYEGCSGFLSGNESEYDVFGAGHAGTALSAALGLAAARDRSKKKEKIVAVLGDGSLTCGSSLEALNNVSETTKDFIIVLNDNKMSISENVGAISKSLNRIISTQGYNRLKALARNFIGQIPHLGKLIIRGIGRLEEAIKSVIVPGVFFEELKIRYIGPIDGHDLSELIRTFTAVKDFEAPVIVHIITEKGKGYKFAEKFPEKFHGLAAFDPVTGENINCSAETSFSSEFGKALSEMAETKNDILAVTAAMKQGVGLAKFAEKFPERFFDVGIAEEHAVVFAAGLAAGGYVPFVAIYATFLQRALDYIYHDICLQKLPVIICADRAGIVDDGPTHHGIYDLSFLRAIPGLSILCPKDACELRKMMEESYNRRVPVVIRYPRGDSSAISAESNKTENLEWGKAEILRDGEDIAIWALGRETRTAMEVAELLSKNGVKASVVNARFAKPIDRELLAAQIAKMPLASVEDCAISGGLASIMRENIPLSCHNDLIHFGWPDEIIGHGDRDLLRKKYQLDAESIAKKIMKFLN